MQCADPAKVKKGGLPMSTVKEIEAAISKLSPAELEELRGWLEKFFQSHESSRLAGAGHLPKPMATSRRKCLTAHDWH